MLALRTARWLLLFGAWIGAAVASAAAPASLSGLWDASVEYGAIRVPFQFGIEQHGERVRGWFFNGDERVVSDGGHVQSGHLVLEFPAYGRHVDVQLGADGALSGSYGPIAPGSSLRSYPFTARRASASTAPAPAPAPAPVPGHSGGAPKAPTIEGLWILSADSGKGDERAWRFIIHQSGERIRAAILRVDGDSGALTGRWQDGSFVLSHFDGARPLLLEVKPEPGDTLTVLLHNSTGSTATLSAHRASTVAADAAAEVADPATHTRVRNAREPFRFSFPDLAGNMVSNTDSRFRGKVLVIDVAGSWCPNCHDEAPFLQTLYRRYHARGLEIVTLSFEEAEQYANPARLRAFVRDFGLQYTVLLAGTPDQLQARLPQAEGLDAYPTTFFIGRDGLVKAVHAGFAAAATGTFNTQLKHEFSRTIERLLAQN